jgi:hypothetical protein
MNFNWELSDFFITSGKKCHISNDEYLFQVFTLKPKIVKVASRKEVPALTGLFIRNTKRIVRLALK